MMIDIKQNFSLKTYNSLRIDKSANYFCEVTSLEESQEAIEFSRLKKLKILVLGSGTNVVLTKNFDGLVIKNKIEGKKRKKESVTLGSGENWHQCVLWSLKQKLNGLENLALIPGTSGAAPIQNIGAYGVEISSKISIVRTINLKTGELIDFSKDDCLFSYRDSFFKKKNNEYLIIALELNLTKNKKSDTSYQSLREYLIKDDINPEKATANQVCRAVTTIRNRLLPDPEIQPNVGSFFKNLIMERKEYRDLKKILKEIPCFKTDDGKCKVPSAYLIEKAGWKGFKKRDVSISPNHALVLLSSGNSSCEEILGFSSTIVEDIHNKFGVKLEIEPSIY